MPTKVTDQQLVACARKDMSAKEVSEAYGVSTTSVLRRARNLGVRLRDTRGGGRSFSDEQMIALLRKGMSQSAIGDALGVTSNAINSRMSLLGLTSTRAPSMPNLTDQQVKDYRTLVRNGYTHEEAMASVTRPRTKIRALPRNYQGA